MKGYTFYIGIRTNKELRDYIEKEDDMPECESFQELREGDEDLIKGKGYIAEEDFDDELFNELPKTLKEAID